MPRHPRLTSSLSHLLGSLRTDQALTTLSGIVMPALWGSVFFWFSGYQRLGPQAHPLVRLLGPGGGRPREGVQQLAWLGLGLG